MFSNQLKSDNNWKTVVVKNWIKPCILWNTFFPNCFFSFLKPEFSQKVTSKSPQTTYNDGTDNNCCCWKIMDWAKVIGVAIMLSGGSNQCWRAWRSRLILDFALDWPARRGRSTFPIFCNSIAVSIQFSYHSPSMICWLFLCICFASRALQWFWGGKIWNWKDC